MDDNLPDLIGNGSGEKKSEINLKDTLDDLGISLICKRFPSITLGSAPQVDLYNGSTSYSDMPSILATDDFQQFLSDSPEARWQNILSGAWPSLYIDHSSVESSALTKEDTFPCPLSPHSMSSIHEESLDHEVTKENFQEKVWLQPQPNPTANELFLDKSINCIPGLSKRHYQQLDNCGFHTVGCQNCRLLKMCGSLNFQF